MHVGMLQNSSSVSVIDGALRLRCAQLQRRDS
jgi:hypothetical protein